MAKKNFKFSTFNWIGVDLLIDEISWVTLRCYNTVLALGIYQ